MRKLLFLGLCLLQGCITSALWSGYDSEEQVAVRTLGEARLLEATIDGDAQRIFARVELVDDNDTLRTAFEGLSTTLGLVPNTPTLPGTLLQRGQVAGCRLDEVRPYLMVALGESNEAQWKMRFDWRGVCARIGASEAPEAYRRLELLREDSLDSWQRQVVDRAWGALAQSGLRGADTAIREAVGWLDSDGNLAPTKSVPSAPNPPVPSFLVVRIRDQNGEVSFVEIPTLLLADPGHSKLSGGDNALGWSYRDDWSVEPRAVAPPGLVRLAASHRTPTFSYEHVQITTRTNSGGFVWRALLTPVTIVADIPFVLFWLWLDDKLDDDSSTSGGC